MTLYSKFPRRLRVGRFTAMFRGVDPDGQTARWEIFFEGKVVGAMYEGSAYGWGRPHFSMARLVWAGPFPEDCSDSRSMNYGMCFDDSGYTSYRECLTEFGKRATRLMDWRWRQTEQWKCSDCGAQSKPRGARDCPRCNGKMNTAAERKTQRRKAAYADKLGKERK